MILDFREQLCEVLHYQRPLRNHKLAKAHSVLQLSHHRLIPLLHLLNLYAKLFLGGGETLDLLLQACELCVLELGLGIAELLLDPLDLADV